MSILLGLGSNQDGPLEQLRSALALLEQEHVSIAAVSSVYRTEPVGPPQPWFLNAAAKVSFEGSPEELLAACQRVERKRGRRREVANGPRTLDVDLLLFGSRVVDTETLRLPHPRLHLRRFVLEPLAEIAPDVVHPELGLTVRLLLERCPDESAVHRLDRLRSLPSTA